MIVKHKYKFVTAFLLIFGLIFESAGARFPHGEPAVTTFQQLNVGGGGFSTGFAVHPDGTMLMRVDIFGGYTANTTLGTTWQQLITQSSMPAAYGANSATPSPFLNGGLWEVGIDPSNSSIFYAMYTPLATNLSYLLRSTNKGASWVQTDLPVNNTNSNDPAGGKFAGQKIAINSSGGAWASTLTNLYYSSNGTTGFTQVNGGTSGLPAATGAPGFVGMQFDPNTPNRMIVGVTGHGVYVSTNANLGASSTWTIISGTATVTNPSMGKIGSDGVYYFSLVDDSNILYRIDTSNVLTNSAPNTQGVAQFAIDPNNPARAVALANGQIAIGGPVNSGTATWGAKNANFTTVSPDAPWQATSTNTSGPKNSAEVHFDPFKTTSGSTVTIGTGSRGPFTVAAGLNIVNGDLLRITNTGTPGNYMLGTASYSGTTLNITVLASDPGGYLGTKTGGSGTFSAWTITKERLWISTGTGMFWTDGLYATAAFTWNSMNFGIDDLVMRQIIWPTSNVPVMAAADFPVWQVPTNPVGATVGLSAFGNGTDAAVSEGTFIDWVKSTPSEIVMVNAQSQGGVLFRGKNTSNGAAGSWVAFTSDPGNNTIIAATDANNMVVANSTAVQYTTNGFTSAPSAVPNWPTGGWSASNGANPNYQGICADTVTANTFYGYNQDNGNVYKFVSSGPTGSTLATGINPGSGTYAPILKCVPGNTGHLFWTGGNPASDSSSFTYTSLATVVASVASATNNPFKFSNGGVTWTSLSNVAGVIAFGFSAAKAGQSYPSILIAGWVSGVYSLWRCDNFDPASAASSCTWNNVGTFPRGWLDSPTTIEGDPSQWGRFITGFNGSGPAIGQVSGQPNGWP